MVEHCPEIRKLVMAGRISDAIVSVQGAYGDLLEHNVPLMFMLKCRQFIEMVAGVDTDVRAGDRAMSATPPPPPNTGHRRKKMKSPSPSALRVAANGSAANGAAKVHDE